MNNLDFYYVAAKNFRCFGSDGIELDLRKYGPIVHVRGDNLDVEDEEERISSNGVGKSSIADIIPYTLFGKTVQKKLKHGNLVNNQVGKKLETEVRWGKYRVVRTREPSRLRMWESNNHDWTDETEITLGGMPATQTLIEEKVGLNYETFVATTIFTDNNAGSFLECDTPMKRQIVENLLSLERYREYGDRAKKKRNEMKQKILLLTKDYEHSEVLVKDAEKRLVEVQKKEITWQQEKQAELTALLRKMKTKREEMESTDAGAAYSAWKSAQQQLVELNASIPNKEDAYNKLQQAVQEANEKLDALRDAKHRFVLEGESHKTALVKQESSIKELEELINSLEAKEGTTCPTCYGTVKKENCKAVVTKANNHIDSCIANKRKEEIALRKVDKAIQERTEKITALVNAISSAQEKSDTVSEQIRIIRDEINSLSEIKKPDSDRDVAVLEEQIDNLTVQTTKKKEELDGPSPFVGMIESSKQEIKDKKVEQKQKKKDLEDAESDLPYYEFFVKAFGDSGIRKFVIDGVVPALNNRIAYWLQYLIDGKIKLGFDNQLEETIERQPPDGDPFVYHAMSGGERRRLNLAVSQAFAHVMMLNSGVCPSLVFLDEVTTNIDPIGVVGVYNMIMELSKERQVFVTTHDHDLLEMLSGCETINLEKKGGFTRIK